MLTPKNAIEKPTGWKTIHHMSREIDAEVCIDEFDAVQLLQGLINEGWIDEAEACAIKARAESEKNADRSPIKLKGLPVDELVWATEELRSGRRAEAMIHLERYLGRDWLGGSLPHAEP